MSNVIWKFVIAIIFIAHGSGHALIFWPLAGRPMSKIHSADSWFLSRILPETITHILAAILFLLALVGFVSAGLGLLGWSVAPTLWPSLAVWASIVSLAGLVLYWNAFPFFMPNKVGAIVVDVAVLIWLLVFL